MDSLAVTPGSEAYGSPSWARRVLGVFLGCAIVAGSFVLFLGIPVVWLWSLARLTSNYLTIYGVALIAAPATMTAWGWVLHRLNALYLRTVQAAPPRRRQTAWLKSLGTERGWREPSALIDLSMGVAVVTALVAFLVWCIFLGALGNGAAPGAW